MQASRVIEPKTQFCHEPKFALLLPHPKELAPTDKREKPIAVTTQADTIGLISFIQYLAKRPRIPSTEQHP